MGASTRSEKQVPKPTGDTLRIEWSQTRNLRVVRISGPVDRDTKRHFDSALVGLGGRDLVIDLTEVESSPEVEITQLLAEIKSRLGHRSLLLEGIDDWVGQPSPRVLGEGQTEVESTAEKDPG